jgi:hypothetical protein
MLLLCASGGSTFRYLLSLVDFCYLFIEQFISFFADCEDLSPFNTPVRHSFEDLVGDLRRSFVLGERIWVRQAVVNCVWSVCTNIRA